LLDALEVVHRIEMVPGKDLSMLTDEHGDLLTENQSIRSCRLFRRSCPESGALHNTPSPHEELSFPERR
jgi:hypothetical protein